MAELLLTEADDAKSVVVQPGDRIVIQLAENPTTGFLWMPDGAVDPSLSVLSSDFLPDPAGGVGGGGTRIFVVQAEQPVVTTLRLKLQRSWEQDDTAIGRFRVDLNVEAPPEAC